MRYDALDHNVYFSASQLYVLFVFRMMLGLERSGHQLVVCSTILNLQVQPADWSRHNYTRTRPAYRLRYIVVRGPGLLIHRHILFYNVNEISVEQDLCLSII